MSVDTITAGMDQKQFRGSNFKKKTIRDEKYLNFVRSLPCIVCQKPGTSHAHHCETGGMGIKGSDHKTLPLCAVHHAEFHQASGKDGGLSPEFLEHAFKRLMAVYRDQ